MNKKAFLAPLALTLAALVAVPNNVEAKADAGNKVDVSVLKESVVAPSDFVIERPNQTGQEMAYHRSHSSHSSHRSHASHYSSRY